MAQVGVKNGGVPSSVKSTDEGELGEGRGGSVGSQLGFGEEEKVNGELARRGFESKARLGSCGGKSGAT